MKKGSMKACPPMKAGKKYGKKGKKAKKSLPPWLKGKGDEGE